MVSKEVLLLIELAGILVWHHSNTSIRSVLNYLIDVELETLADNSILSDSKLLERVDFDC
jgi:hypothetical protein